MATDNGFSIRVNGDVTWNSGTLCDSNSRRESTYLGTSQYFQGACGGHFHRPVEKGYGIGNAETTGPMLVP